MFEESPEELGPQSSGRRRGGPPRHGAVADLLDQPEGSFPERSTLGLFKRIAANPGLSILLIGVGLLRIKIVWPGRCESSHCNNPKVLLRNIREKVSIRTGGGLLRFRT